MNYEAGIFILPYYCNPFRTPVKNRPLALASPGT